jgi:hypothetical protein
MICQHFSGHTVKLLYAAIRNPQATNSHWPNGEPLAVVKDFNILKYRLSSLSPGLIGLMMHQFGFQGMEEAF